MNKDNFDSLELVSYDLAKETKWAGYDWGGFKMYFDNNGWEELYKPTRSRLQRWLREEHNIDCEARLSGRYGKKQVRKYSYTIKRKNVINMDCTRTFDSYEEALERGLQKSLEIINE